MRIMVLELKDQDSPIFDKIMEVVKCCPDIEYMKIKDEPMLSLPGLEIYPGRRKIYRDLREINLTATLNPKSTLPFYLYSYFITLFPECRDHSSVTSDRRTVTP